MRVHAEPSPGEDKSLVLYDDELLEDYLRDSPTHQERTLPRESSSSCGTSTTFAPGIRSKAWTILDIACRVTAPSGIPVVMIPLYRIVYGTVLKNSKHSISTATTKLIIATGAIISIKSFWDLESKRDSETYWVRNFVIRISTPGWSKALLERFVNCVSAAKAVDPNTTVLFETNPENSQFGRGSQPWKYRLRASRPLETIDLDDNVKSDLIADIDRFMDESRSKCLYIMSLNEVENEKYLKKLFGSPHKDDFLLLEDIDCAGIVRENMRGEGKKASVPNDKDANTPLQQATEGNLGISLAGLLSAIDGLPDGVVLVMTSNKPETLEQALIRPGRIDKQVFFGNVNHAVAKSIFVRMYQDDSNASGSQKGLPATRLDELGNTFASRIPNLQLTPAEIQGFLIEHSSAPETAIADVDPWVSDVLTAKKADRNIIGAAIPPP
ncbi:hypothetical protein PMIN04_009662 [Paraphaeosphaeria minitans]